MGLGIGAAAVYLRTFYAVSPWGLESQQWAHQTNQTEGKKEWDMNQLTTIQQAALDKITALLTIEAETGTITKRARNNVMQGLDPNDLAAIAPAIIRFKQSIPPKAFGGNNSVDGGAK